MERAWEEIHHGADMNIPKIYKFIIKYITPLFLLLILASWAYQEWWPMILMKNVPAPDRPFILATRFSLIALFITLSILVKVAWRKKRKQVKA